MSNDSGYTKSWDELKDDIQQHIGEQKGLDRDFLFHYLNELDFANHWDQAKQNEWGVDMKHCTRGWDNKGYYYFFKWKNSRVEEVKEVDVDV